MANLLLSFLHSPRKCKGKEKKQVCRGEKRKTTPPPPSPFPAVAWEGVGVYEGWKGFGEIGGGGGGGGVGLHVARFPSFVFRIGGGGGRRKRRGDIFLALCSPHKGEKGFRFDK